MHPSAYHPEPTRRKPLVHVTVRCNDVEIPEDDRDRIAAKVADLLRYDVPQLNVAYPDTGYNVLVEVTSA